MNANVAPRRHAPIGARLARAAAQSLCQTAARLYRAAQRMESGKSAEDERHHARSLLATHGKLD